jgi:hypothetical protein
VGASFNWDFDATGVDANGSHENTIGFAVAHLFEIPGTYQVAVRVRDLAGNSGSATVAITVSAMSGTIYYVATNGSDSNSGTDTSHPFLTVSKGLTKATTNNSVLLRRGDAFSAVAAINFSSVTGPVLIGSYSDPASPSSVAPILNFSSSSIVLSKSSDLRFVDLHLKEPTNNSGAFSLNAANTNNLLLRVETEAAGVTTDGNQVYLGLTTDSTFIVDCHFHDFGGVGIYSDGPVRLGLIGTTVEGYYIAEHGMRLQGCGEVGNGGDGSCDSTTGRAGNLEYVAENTFNGDLSGSRDAVPFDAVTFRGDNKNIVFVNNRTNQLVSFQPQNDDAIEFVGNVLAEGNLILDPRSIGASSFNVSANHVVIRNNIIANASTAVQIRGGGKTPSTWIDQISVFNNTSYYPSTGTAGVALFLTQSGTSGSVVVKNNLFYDAESPGMYGPPAFANHTGAYSEDHNLVYSPNDSAFIRLTGTGDVTGNPLVVSIDPSNANAFRLSLGSPAIDAGTMTPVYQDFVGTARPQGSGWDIGAFEFAP